MLYSSCARELKPRIRGLLLSEKLISDHGVFSSEESQQGAANGQDKGVVLGCAGLWISGAGSRAGLTSSRPPPLWTSILPTSIFCVSLLIQNRPERCRRQQSESIGVPLEIEQEERLMNRSYIDRYDSF